MRATGATELAPPSRRLCGVTTDSRSVEPGNVFVALRGAAHDGHAYVPQAIASGAHAVVVERALDAPDGVGVYRVDDTLSALGALAALHRRRYDVPLVAITGSVGKTSTKELAAAALLGLGRHTAYTRGNLNNRVGVPMTLFTVGPEHDAAVIEIGMNVPGEIADLTAMTAPTVGVVTSVAEVHTEGVGGSRASRARRARCSPGWPRARRPSGTPTSRCSRRTRRRRRRGAGSAMVAGEAADVRLVRWELDGLTTRASYRVPSREHPVELALAMLGEAAATNAAAALAIALAIDPARLDEAAEAIAAVPPHAHRMVPAELSSGLLVIDDTYNASPRSTSAALETAALLAQARGGKLVAVLGDMLELGSHAERLHAQIGREAIRAGSRALVACGELMTHAGKAALSSAMEQRGERAKIVLLRNPEDAADCVRELARPGDVVLVKGSRGMRMERVIEALAEEGQ
ncbi:MAG: UDP-N-acetylmuramoyl-tripeptide--D-alanyl-D-alanine ligase [Sandaracinaceae bacterium]|nr:UDP-N-acetylmuramoyl-tripeptide--D-alanyl-D-alanine ligase [Sandaracinaceae bacterium]